MGLICTRNSLTLYLAIFFYRSCQGDSGGALLYSKNGRWYAGGVVSYATGCGRQAFPTVFTKTSAYIDWIRAMMN